MEGVPPSIPKSVGYFHIVCIVLRVDPWMRKCSRYCKGLFIEEQTFSDIHKSQVCEMGKAAAKWGDLTLKLYTLAPEDNQTWNKIHAGMYFMFLIKLAAGLWQSLAAPHLPLPLGHSSFHWKSWGNVSDKCLVWPTWHWPWAKRHVIFELKLCNSDCFRNEQYIGSLSCTLSEFSASCVGNWKAPTLTCRWQSMPVQQWWWAL